MLSQRSKSTATNLYRGECVIKKLICLLLGHDTTYLMKGVYFDGGVTFTDKKIEFKCERCGLIREPNEDERDDAMKELLKQNGP